MPIFLSSRLRKTLAWLALCAMCFGSLAPSVSRWLVAQAQAAQLVVVCAEHGMETIPIAQLLQTQAQAQAHEPGLAYHHGNPSGKAGGEQPFSDLDDCCPYCALSHHSPYVPAVTAAFAPHAPPLDVRSVDVDAHALALQPWREPHMPGAPPRARA
ncbi:MAG: DUF2946 domain-containing protein [Burkholderiaceae bacterium]|jgi:hypothetical protein|nr:DUF2946 domain-containing protein [Burkholderiaceae bacterium]